MSEKPTIRGAAKVVTALDRAGIDELEAFADRDREPTGLTIIDAPKAAQRRGPEIDVCRLSDLADGIIAQSKVPTLDFGIRGLNDKAPLPMRAMATLLGPTGAGKTSLAVTIGAHRARYSTEPTSAQGPTIHLLYELTREQLAARRVSQVAPFSWRQVIGGALTADEIAAFLVGEHYYVVKAPRGAGLTDTAKRAMDEVQKLSPGTPLLIVDYLQRIKGGGNDIRQSTANVVDDLVDLTESRDMFTLLLSKGSRAGSRSMRDGKTRGEALVDAAAETSAIEAGSAVMLAITYENRDSDQVGPLDARLEVAKARYGITGAAVGMRFDGARGRWIEQDGLPLTGAEREATDRVLKAARGQATGFDSATELHKAARGNKAENLAAIRRELQIVGRLERRDGRIFAREGCQ